MRFRIIPFGVSWAITLATVGCNSPVNPPVAPTPPSPAAPIKAGPSVQMQPLTADQLAQILGVNAWTAKFSGGAVEVWLEVEETGQSTLPRRIPEAGYVGTGAANQSTEGTIVLWWTRREDRQGGVLSINSSGGGYTKGLGKDDFTFGWSGFGATTSTLKARDLGDGEPGREFVIVDYDAKEMPRDGDPKPPRRVHLKLMGRFAAPK